LATTSIRSALIPPALAGKICLGKSNVPRFWASIWIDVLKASLETTTKQRHLSALARLYKAAERQLGSDCLDRLLADLDFDALEDVLVGFLAQLRNEAAIDGADLEKLTHGWAISVHKAQGSAFRRVILPITPSRLLDRTALRRVQKPGDCHENRKDHFGWYCGRHHHQLGGFGPTSAYGNGYQS
jgi:hypothetical protein